MSRHAWSKPWVSWAWSTGVDARNVRNIVLVRPVASMIEFKQMWSAPDTRKALLAGLADKGFGREPLAEMQKVIEAENSDLFDVLAYVAFAAEPVTRAARAAAAQAATAATFTQKQQAFVDFVLAQYVRQGVGELDQDKLSPLLQLKYRALNDAFAELGRPDQVRGLFTGFQRHLYAHPQPN